MGKLKLTPDATFQAKVAVPVPGGESDVLLTFQYRSRSDAKAWVDALGDKPDAEILLECVKAWDLDDEFSAENVKRLCEAYPGAGGVIVSRYIVELSGIRQGN